MSEMSDTQKNIGKLIARDSQRDAIHIAVAPTRAIVRVHPGQSVNRMGVPDKATSVGIVDPFLAADVEPGQWFYLFLHPNTITGLRHQWTHPAWPEPSAAIMGLADDLGLSYGETLEALRDYADTNDYYIIRHAINYGADMPTVWTDVERLTGVTVKDKTQFPFSCSC